jgi:error-prone DNA polymerase
VRAGAFGFTGIDKKELLWAAHAHTGRKRKENETVPLFRSKSKDFNLPELRTDFLEEAYDQMELLGFALCSPFDLLAEPMPEHFKAADLPSKIGEVVVTVGYLVTVKNTKTADGKLMQFGTFLDAEGQWLDTVHFPPVAARFPFRGRGIYSIKGRVSEEFGAISVEVVGLEKLAINGVER